MAKQYRSDAMASIHETMEALHEVGAIDKQTMREIADDLGIATSTLYAYLRHRGVPIGGRPRPVSPTA
jgi:DNA-binding transcriptional regulator YiaG